MTIDYTGPWEEIPAGERRDGLQKELDFEISEQHPLWSVNPRVIGKNMGTDDVIVELADDRFAIVHLTWSG